MLIKLGGWLEVEVSRVALYVRCGSRDWFVSRAEGLVRG